MRALMTLLILAVAGLAVFAQQWAERARRPGNTATPTTNAATTAVEEKSLNDTEPLVTDVTTGEGAVAINGRHAVVHYTGWLYDPAAPERKGRPFDSSREHGEPFEFEVGGGQVIRGWDLGVAGMKVGGKRRLVVPAELGYGARGAGGVIPGGATLVFDVELLEVR